MRDINLIIVWTIALGLLLVFIGIACGEEWSDEEICQAIFKAEGGYKATYLYGIRSIPYKDEAEAKQICLNTIRNQRRRHRAHDCGKTYMVCLRDRYCPLQAENDPLGLNSNWLKNVRYFLGVL